MDGACKERWYEGKNDGYKSMGVFLSILTLYLIINYGCLEDLLLIIKPK